MRKYNVGLLPKLRRIHASKPAHQRFSWTPLNLAELSQDQGYKDGQIGKLIDAYDEFFPDLEEQTWWLSVAMKREALAGTAIDRMAPDTIRAEFYQAVLLASGYPFWRMWEISAPVLPLLTLMLPLKQ